MPDAKSDIDKIIASSGNVLLENIETLDNKVRISGVVVLQNAVPDCADGSGGT